MSEGSTALYEVSLDPGNWGGKAARDGKTVVIRNAAMIDDGGDDEIWGFGGSAEETSSMDGEPPTESARITMGDQQWLVGALAEEAMIKSRQQTTYARYGTPEWNALIAALFVKLYSKRSGAVALTMSLPVSQIKAGRAPEIIDMVTGIWEIEHEGKHLVYEVRDDMISMIPEGLGSLASLCLSESGRSFTDRGLAQSRVVLFDFGGFTLDIMTFRNLGKGPYNESLDTGLLHIRNEIERRIMRQYNRGRMSTIDLDKIIRTGTYKHAGGPPDNVSDIVQSSVVGLVQDALRVWREDLGSGVDYDTVVISGGGGPLIGPLLEPQLGHGDVRIIPEGQAHLANVLGGLYHRKFVQRYAAEKVR